MSDDGRIQVSVRCSVKLCAYEYLEMARVTPPSVRSNAPGTTTMDIGVPEGWTVDENGANCGGHR